MQLVLDERDALLLLRCEERLAARRCIGFVLVLAFRGAPCSGPLAVVLPAVLLAGLLGSLGRRWVVCGELCRGFLEGDRAEARRFDLRGGDEGEDVPLELLSQGLRGWYRSVNWHA